MQRLAQQQIKENGKYPSAILQYAGNIPFGRNQLQQKNKGT